MTVRRPSEQDLKTMAASYHFDLNAEELAVFPKFIDASFRSFDRLDGMVEPKLPVRYPRTAGRRPLPENNPYGAWAWQCAIPGAGSGPLLGKRIALKDNVAVAGVPLTNGTPVLEGFIPDIDATLVTRILDQGGTIVGKAMCESSSFSGGSHTSYPWPVRNPRDPSRMAGGSSSGSAVLVATGEVDMAIGGDQGGSIRIPAAWCGVVGLKPTFGLVPYTGILSNDWTVDCAGPITASAEDAALLLEVIAGPDGLDPRQAGMPPCAPYREALAGGVAGLRVGLLQEGFAVPGLSQPGVDEAVRAAAGRLERLGARVKELSIPMHLDGVHVWRGFRMEGSWKVVAQDPAGGHGWLGYYDTNYVDFYGRSRRTRANDLSPNVKLLILQGHYLADRYHGRYYAKAQNLRRVLTAAYDHALEEVDLLLMPTAPFTAPVLKEQWTLEEYMTVSLNMIHNTATFSVTGHPAISVPCGSVDNLPVGLMLVGRRFEDATVLRAAHGFERG